MALDLTIAYINSLPMSDDQKKTMIDQLRAAAAKLYPPTTAVQGKYDAMGKPIPEGHTESELETIMKPGGMQYDAPPGGWPKRSDDQSNCTDGSRVYWHTDSQGGGYWVDKAVADAVGSAPANADWAAAEQRMKDQTQQPSAAAPVPPAPGDPLVTEEG